MIEKQTLPKSHLDESMRRLLWNGKNGKLRNWLSVDELSHIVMRERDRADRRDIEFSVLLIRLNAPEQCEANLAGLLEFFNSRLRITDDFARIAPDAVGVVLPDTPADGACALASQLQALSRARGIEFNHQVYVYPFDDDDTDDMNGVDVLNYHRGPTTQQEIKPLLFCQAAPLWKRAIDIVVALVSLILLLPLFVVTAVLVKCTSRGTIFFTQVREGFAGQRFKMYKFRTMRPDAEKLKEGLRHLSEQDGPAFKIENDPRLTVIGKFLRRTCIDELPQLVNVLRGEMTLVGPRPLPVNESLACARWQRRRLEVLPGLTCIWQIEGNRKTPFSEWMRMDLRYMRKIGFWTDLRLVLRTIVTVFFRRKSA